jgi:hypothetical protein
VPTSPVDEGNAFIMHATGPECGELWARAASGTLRSVRGVQNVPMYYVVVLRERGAAYYAASLPNVPGFAPYPSMTPLAIDAFGSDPTVYAGVHQSVLGQIGFRVDTRVYRTQVAALPGYDQWYGSATGADRMTGHGSLEGSRAAAGGDWVSWSGSFERTAEGAVATTGNDAASLTLPTPAGLVHAVIHADHRPVEAVALLFRVRDGDNYWAFEVGSEQCALLIKENGVVARFPATSAQRLAPVGPNAVQITDDGERIRLSLNGELVYSTEFVDRRLSDGRGVGVMAGGESGAARITDFEAHPRTVRIPECFDLGAPWRPESGDVVAADDFRGEAGDLDGRVTPVGTRTWRRSVGVGHIDLTGAGVARVRGTVSQPSPGRTAYAIPWSDARFADLSVEITPPGTRKGSLERGRGGVIFWQDDRNYITLSVFIDDWYGMSIAAFFYRDGYEELYDAVWTNLGRRLHWGMPYDFLVVFDGSRFTAFVDGEPVLHRALSDIYPDWTELRIAEVGLVSNWEWGADTGTLFRNFVARGR